MLKFSKIVSNVFQKSVLTGTFFCLFAAFPVFSQKNSIPTKDDPPLMVKNGLPGEMHRRLEALVGEWNVEMSLYIAGGTPEKPLVSTDLTCHRSWISETGNKFIKDVTEGTLNGNPYYRFGILGYSTMDKRYEWNTIDALNSMMMTYKGVKETTTANGDIIMSGEFTDQGVLGDKYAGKNIKQRTVIKIESPDRHVFELYFTPPGEKERLVDRKVYNRRNKTFKFI